jgi:hypothetical protein
MPELPTVTSAKGAEYSVDSPQGKMIVQAKNRAAESAAKAAVASKPAMEGSTVAAGFIVVDKHLQTISDNVVSIGESVGTMVSISQADSRGDALNSANVPQSDLQPVTPDDDGVYRGGRDDGADADGGGLGALGGIGAVIGGIGKGLSFWGTPVAMLGALTFLGFLGGLILIGWAGSKVFEKSAASIVAGMETLSDADVDTDKVIAMGEALKTFGIAMAAEGLGAGIGSLGNLVSGIADGFAGFLGIEKKDPMVALKAFAQHEITEDEIKQIEINARALTIFSGAMTVSAGADFVTSVANLASGVVNFVASFFPTKEDPMLKMIKFASHKITDDDVAQIQRNALALIGFQTGMATVSTITVWKDIADLASGIVNFAASFFPEGKDPMLEMIKFAGHEITQKQVDQIKLNAGALVAFSSTMALADTMGAVSAVSQLFSGIATGISKLFGLDAPDPMLQMKEFAKHEITQKQVDQIKLNADALVNFSTAMALYSAGTAGAAALDLIGSMATGITNFFGGTTGIDYEEIETFASHDLGKHEAAITANAKVLSAFSKVMSEHASKQAGVEWQNIGVNILGAIGSIFGGKPEDKIPYDEITAFAGVTWDENTKKKIETNAATLHAYTTAIATMSSLKQGEGFWSSIGTTLTGAFSALLGQDKMPIEEITAFTETELDLKVVENNISAIEKFMTFGTSLNDWVPGDTGKFGDFAAGLVGISHGIQYALYGGEKKFVIPGWADNIRIKEGEGLASVNLMDMQNSASGIAVLRHALTSNEPLQALQDASAAMDASTGGVTIVNANNNSTNNSSAATNNYREMDVDHNEQSGSWYSRIDWTPWN